jgi:hypothetical protein
LNPGMHSGTFENHHRRRPRARPRPGTMPRGATTENHATLAARRGKAMQAEVRTILCAFAQLVDGHDATIDSRFGSGVGIPSKSRALPHGRATEQIRGSSLQPARQQGVDLDPTTYGTLTRPWFLSRSYRKCSASTENK